MKHEPHEVRATREIHSHLFVAAHAALELALESTRKPAHEGLEPRYWAILGQNMNWSMLNEMATRLDGRVDWFNDRGFVAMVPRGLDVAIRLGRGDAQGRPNDTKEREESAPFAQFLEGLPVLFEDSKLRPVFGGYSLHRSGRGSEEHVEIDRFVLAKYKGQEHEWSWALDPADPGRVRSVLHGRAKELEIVPTFIPIPRQDRFAS